MKRSALVTVLFTFIVCIPGFAQNSPILLDFSGDTAEANQVTLMGAGFGQYPAPEVTFSDIPTDNAFDGATDGKGMIVQADPGEGVMVLTQPIQTTNCALIRCSVRASAPHASIYLASIDQGENTFVSTLTASNGNFFVNRYSRLADFFLPPSTGFQGIVQVTNTSSTDPVTVYLDNLEILILDRDQIVLNVAEITGEKSEPITTPTPEPPTPTSTPIPEIPTAIPTPTSSSGTTVNWAGDWSGTILDSESDQNWGNPTVNANKTFQTLSIQSLSDNNYRLSVQLPQPNSIDAQLAYHVLMRDIVVEQDEDGDFLKNIVRTWKVGDDVLLAMVCEAGFESPQMKDLYWASFYGGVLTRNGTTLPDIPLENIIPASNRLLIHGYYLEADENWGNGYIIFGRHTIDMNIQQQKNGQWTLYPMNDPNAVFEIQKVQPGLWSASIDHLDEDGDNERALLLLYTLPGNQLAVSVSASVYKENLYVETAFVGSTVDFVKEEGDVNINSSEIFPDPNFRSVVEEALGVSAGEPFTPVQAAAFNGEIVCPQKEIQSMRGIEYLNNIRQLDCSYNQISYLDVTQNTALVELVCYTNQLTNLDVTHNTVLESLYCSNNQLTNLDVTQNTVLKSLSCGNNQLTSLNVAQNAPLMELDCGNNLLTNLDLIQNTVLKDLYCYDNKLTRLDVTHNTALALLGCSGNQLNHLDVTQNLALRDLSCSSNLLTNLDVTRNISLTFMGCSYNQLTELNITNNTALTILLCGSNRLSSLDVTKNTALTWLECDSNLLTNLDLMKNTVLESLVCSYNQLTNLNVTKNAALESLNCNYNQLPNLDVTKNVALKWLHCIYNQLTSLDVTQNTALMVLDCHDNQLTSLDVTQNPALYDFNCSQNQLNCLDVTHNNALLWIYCNGNQLISLDVTQNTALTEIVCYSNQLTSLNVSQNTMLTDLWCSSNQLTSLDVSQNMALTDLRCNSNQLTSLDVSQNLNLMNFFYDKYITRDGQQIPVTVIGWPKN